MRQVTRDRALQWLALGFVVAAGCAPLRARHTRLEMFQWVSQPIAFAPPPARWQRQEDDTGGLQGVRFVLTGGGDQCIGVYAHRRLAERDRRGAIARLIARRDSLTRREFLDQLSLVRPRMEDPISPREAATAQAINDAVDRAVHDVDEQPEFVAADLEAAHRAATAYQPTLEELLPHIRLRPERMPEPDRWRIGHGRDTTLADHPAFASDGTLITPGRPLLYREIFWVVNGCAFKAVYQGTERDLETFAKVVNSIRFPDGADVAGQDVAAN